MPRMLKPLSILTGTRGQFISEITVRKTGETVISEHLCILSELLHDKYLSLPNDNHLYCVTSEHTREQLGRKEKAAFSIEYQFVYPFWGKSVFDTLSPIGQPASFSCSPEFFNQKCAEFSSELNGAIGRFL